MHLKARQMRPIDKGTVPLDDAGNPISVNDYVMWRRRLIERIGYYCAYCNMPLSHALQVEHVVPKNPPSGYTPGDPLSWDNMLLACGPCNNTKSNKPVDAATYYLPENHNTNLPFRIIPHNVDAEAAIVDVAIGLQPAQIRKAKDTIALTGLNVVDKRQSIVDIRWKKRRQAIVSVEAAYDVYQQLKKINGADLSKSASYMSIWAKDAGFFWLWFDKFKNEQEVLSALIRDLPGTAAVCYDSANAFNAIPRNPGNADPI